MYVAFNQFAGTHHGAVQAQLNHQPHWFPGSQNSTLIADHLPAGVTVAQKNAALPLTHIHHGPPKALISINQELIVSVSRTFIIAILPSGAHPEKSNVHPVISKFSYCLIILFSIAFASS